MSHEAEELERAALVSLQIAKDLGVETHEIGSALVSLASALPASAIVINRTLGLGLSEPAEPAAVERIVELYETAGIGRYFVQLHPRAQPANLPEMLESRGLEKARGWQKFSRGRETIDAPASDLEIREVDAAHAMTFAEIVCDAFDLGAVAQPWMACMPSLDKWHVFMTFDGETPVGAGAIYIDGELAWTDFGATAPQHRRRGSQSALLRHRVAFALDHGCKRIFTCTGEEVPGDPQHSYANILKCGFVEDYVRTNYAPRR